MTDNGNLILDWKFKPTQVFKYYNIPFYREIRMFSSFMPIIYLGYQLASDCIEVG